MAISKKKTTTAAKTAANPSSSSSSSHPPYFQMISEAITSLKDRTGSSQPAIAKFIDEKYASLLPPNYKKLLSIQLKNLVKSEKLVKVKNSYKVSASQKVTTVSKKGEKKVVEKSVKVKMLSQVKTPELLKKNKEKGSVEKPASGGRKMKRLSQVKTPEAMKMKKKKAGSTSKIAAKKAMK